MMGRICPRNAASSAVGFVSGSWRGQKCEPSIWCLAWTKKWKTHIWLLRSSLAPYIEFLYLSHGYFFFAPNPGPNHILEFRFRPPTSGSSSESLSTRLDDSQTGELIADPDGSLTTWLMRRQNWSDTFSITWKITRIFNRTSTLLSESGWCSRWRPDWMNWSNPAYRHS